MKWLQPNLGTNMLDGSVIGIDKFGASAPAAKVMEEYGFTVAHVVEVVKNLK